MEITHNFMYIPSNPHDNITGGTHIARDTDDRN